MIEPGDILKSKGWFNLLSTCRSTNRITDVCGEVKEGEYFIVISKLNKPGMYIMTPKCLGWFYGYCEK